MKEVDRHFAEFKQKPQVVAEVPGVMKIIGSYAQYCKGLVLCAADDRRLKVSISERKDNQVFIHNSEIMETKHFALSSLRFKKEDKWANFAKAILPYALKEKAIDNGFNITLEGNLLQEGSVLFGIATSVGIILSLNQLLNLNLQDYYIQESVLAACNSLGVDKKCLPEVQTMLFSRPDKFIMCNTNLNTYEILDNPFKGDISLIVTDSGISLDQMDELFEDVSYNCLCAMQEFNRSYHRDSFINMQDSDFSDKIYPVSGETRQICTYLYDEYKASIQIRKSILNSDALMTGRAFSKIQRAISDKLEISCPELEWLIKRANEVSGCFGSLSVLYPGNLILLLIKTSDIEQYKTKIEEYEHIFGLEAKTSIFTPNDRATVK